MRRETESESVRRPGTSPQPEPHSHSHRGQSAGAREQSPARDVHASMSCSEVGGRDEEHEAEQRDYSAARQRWATKRAAHGHTCR